MAEDIVFKIDDKALDTLLNGPSGPVGDHLSKIADQVIAGGMALVGVRTGRLKQSFRKNHRRSSVGQEIVVGAYTPYAYVHHEGEKPHIITPHHGRVLRFQSKGRVVYARVVRHPGSRGRKYLTIPLEAAVR